jgi:hypothetical protein
MKGGFFGWILEFGLEMKGFEGGCLYGIWGNRLYNSCMHENNLYFVGA